MARAHRGRLQAIALLRNPADRLWSAYHTYPQYAGKYGPGAAGVRAYLAEQAQAFGACARAHGARACAMRFEALSDSLQAVYYHCDQLLKGMHAPFVAEWLDALHGTAAAVATIDAGGGGRSAGGAEDGGSSAPLIAGRARAGGHMLFVLSEDYFEPASRAAVIARVVAFAGIRVGAAEVEAIAAAAHKRPLHRRRWGIGAGEAALPSWAMPASLRAELDSFYRPYNAELARLLGEPRCASWPVYRGPADAAGATAVPTARQ
jgi:hypothetical protein